MRSISNLAFNLIKLQCLNCVDDKNLLWPTHSTTETQLNRELVTKFAPHLSLLIKVVDEGGKQASTHAP
jgi:hypothetical protein